VEISFWRYSATGNLFLFFDNRDGELSKISAETCAKWAEEEKVDGLIFLEKSSNDEAQFHMRYLNADGGEVEMCGNGARSILHFAHQVLEIPTNANDEYQFTTLCSLYRGKPIELYPLQMTELAEINAIAVNDLIPQSTFAFYLNTGVPHCVFEWDNLRELDLNKLGAKVRYDQRFPKGSNANFFKIISFGKVEMRTYERGVEGETESCGTGATAVALSLAMNKKWKSPIEVKVPGGELEIRFNSDFSKVYLAGAVELLSEGVKKFF